MKKYYELTNFVLRTEMGLDYNNYYNTTCGVKQGGILFPFLFNIYYDDMIEECITANIGASLNGENMSVIAYADDIVLLSPSLNHLKRLVKICNDYK